MFFLINGMPTGVYNCFPSNFKFYIFYHSIHYGLVKKTIWIKNGNETTGNKVIYFMFRIS